MPGYLTNDGVLWEMLCLCLFRGALAFQSAYKMCICFGSVELKPGPYIFVNDCTLSRELSPTLIPVFILRTPLQ